MTPATTKNRPAVHDLQARAESAIRDDFGANKRKSHARLSRGARLHLIDVLSRWGVTGLALIAGISIFIAVMSGRAFPVRGSVWLLIMLGALYVCRRLRKDYRSGEKIASKPFRWRANYTSALSVLSAAFGAGALFTTPAQMPPGEALQISALILIGTIMASAFHIAHGRATMAALLPASLFVIASVWQTASASVAIFGAGALVVAASAGLYLASRQLQANTASRFPRTTFLRREIEDDGDYATQGAFEHGVAQIQ